MHNSYYFLRQVAKVLDTRLKGYTLVSSFSQSKDELLIEFNNSVNSFFFRASLLPELQCLSFPDQLNRARKNSIDLFTSVLMKKVKSVRVHMNDRSLSIDLEDTSGLLFKMHGRQSNIMLVEGKVTAEVFRKNLFADLGLNPTTLDREIDWSEKAFNTATDLHSHFFTFGNEVWDFLEENNFRSKSPAEQWKAMQDLKQRLESPTHYYHLEFNNKLVFSLLDRKSVV